jgi:hypothetical protein
MAKQTISLPDGVFYQNRDRVSADEYWLQLILRALNIPQEDLPLETGLVFQDLKRRKRTIVNKYRTEHKKFSRAKVFLHYSPHLFPQEESKREIFLGRLDSLGCLTKYSESLSSQGEPLLTLHILLGYRGVVSNPENLSNSNEEIKRKLSKEFEASLAASSATKSPSLSSLSSLSYQEALKKIPNLSPSLREEVQAMLEVNASDEEDKRPLTFPEEEIVEVIRDGLGSPQANPPVDNSTR